MKYILITFLVGVGFFLGNEFGASLYYYYKTGVFQSSVLALIQSPEELLLRGLFSATFSLIPVYLFKRKNKFKVLFFLYICIVFVIKIVEFFLTWKTISNYNLSTFFDVVNIVFINMQMTIFILVVAVIMFLIGKKGNS
jgi:hypothetical protein